VGVSRRRFVERAAAFGFSIPVIGGLALTARPRGTAAQEAEEYGVHVFTREFRVKELPTFADGSVLFMMRRALSKDDPIVESFYAGSTLY